mmetsp:Transcript_4908/g.12029  ORF Transcript_4908/g.12029 Transcript_4908/m.12029 type:complete len:98 (+) Transcript_4908:118-411(+)|eukprot:CAMPEP_0202868416 /NCGR_PEP_ID=MMETSP1391-20130828/10864_1 /ASSEMBLY_ACC=CAM_ASM_000867 /TAXON_ID=1034604 /ORGANISM="Chlamydomonas leiostraca, Strain SAG 11-49" /LENGTH=97 /DNA_ID=CAMNT_0049548589 /DNA_START=92 /DNA_END=385 /DNA_ORIENTATION=-
MLSRVNTTSIVSRGATRTAVVTRAAVQSQGNPLSSMDLKVEEVKKILAKEHEHHGQGKVFMLQCSGAGKRMFCGTAVVHQQNMSGQAVQSVDYSLFG